MRHQGIDPVFQAYSLLFLCLEKINSILFQFNSEEDYQRYWILALMINNATDQTIYYPYNFVGQSNGNTIYEA